MYLFLNWLSLGVHSIPIRGPAIPFIRGEQPRVSKRRTVPQYGLTLLRLTGQSRFSNGCLTVITIYNGRWEP
jgi:hypothetical protein